MRLGWQEVRRRAKEFSVRWKDAHYEKGETQTFYNEFFQIFGIDRKRVAIFERKIQLIDARRRGFIDLFWPSVLLVEQKSAGKDLFKAGQQADDYVLGLRDRDLPRFVLVCDFQRFRLRRLETGHEVKLCFAIMGNPPFVGAKYQTAEQRAQIKGLLASGKSKGTLDYVSGWFLKAGSYIQKGPTRVGFVATNSITQGEQVAQVTKQSGDRGVDVVANFQFGITEIKEVVQVKRSELTIRRPLIDQLRGALPYHGAIRGTLITLGKFARGVEESALFPGAAPITLIDGERLVDLVEKHQVGLRRKPAHLLEIDEAFFAERNFESDASRRTDEGGLE